MCRCSYTHARLRITHGDHTARLSRGHHGGYQTRKRATGRVSTSPPLVHLAGTRLPTHLNTQSSKASGLESAFKSVRCFSRSRARYRKPPGNTRPFDAPFRSSTRLAGPRRTLELTRRSLPDLNRRSSLHCRNHYRRSAEDRARRNPGTDHRALSLSKLAAMAFGEVDPNVPLLLRHPASHLLDEPDVCGGTRKFTAPLRTSSLHLESRVNGRSRTDTRRTSLSPAASPCRCDGRRTPAHVVAPAGRNESATAFALVCAVRSRQPVLSRLSAAEKERLSS